MKQPKVIAALVVAVTMFLTVLVAQTVLASPSQAYGWTAPNCYKPVVTGEVCIQVHSVASGNGLRVDQVHLCLIKHPQWPYPGPNGTFQNGMALYGSAGAWIGSFNLADTGASQAGSCSYTYPGGANQAGNGSCYLATGRVDMPGGPDATWTLRGKVLGGAWNC